MLDSPGDEAAAEVPLPQADVHLHPDPHRDREAEAADAVALPGEDVEVARLAAHVHPTTDLMYKSNCSQIMGF